MTERYVFDLLVSPDDYPKIIKLHFLGGGGARVLPGTLKRSTDPVHGERLQFSDGDGGGSALLRTVIGITLA